MSRIENTIKGRGATHGDPEQNACIYTELRDIFATGGRLDPLHEWALDMIAHKLARILTGDPTEPDHWHNIAGYATIVEQALRDASGTMRLPENFIFGHAREVLDGDLNALYTAFLWKDTPQGHDYWRAIVEGRKPLDHGARACIENWLAIAQDAPKPRVVYDPKMPPYGDSGNTFAGR